MRITVAAIIVIRVAELNTQKTINSSSIRIFADGTAKLVADSHEVRRDLLLDDRFFFCVVRTQEHLFLRPVLWSEGRFHLNRRK